VDRGRLRLWFGILIVLVAAATASPVLRNDLTQDDVPLIREDARIHDLGNIREILATPFWPEAGGAGHHRPLMTLTLAVEWAMGRGAFITYKILSLTLVAAVALAVFMLVGELLPLGWAAAVALGFAVHPVHVEAVAVGINQGELLIGLGYTLVVYWYLRMRRQRIPGWPEQLGLAAVIFVATLYRETGVVLPALLGAVELLLIRDRDWRRTLGHFRRTILLQVLMVAIVLYMRDAVMGGEVRGTFTAEALQGLGLGGRALTMLGVVPEYLRLLLWPASLQADYSPGEIVGATTWGQAQSLGLLILLLVGTLAVRLWRTAPVVVFGLAWIAIGIAPVHNVLVPAGIVLAERTLFLPSIGAMLVLGGLASGIAPPNGAAWRQATLGALVALAVVLGASRSWSRYHVWRSQIGLWTQTVIDAPDSYRAWVALGSLMIRPEHREMGLRFGERGMALYEHPSIMIGLAQRHQERNRCDLALPLFKRALELIEFAPGRSEYLSCLTWEGQYDLAYHEAMRGIGTGYYHNVFRAWRRYIETAIREQAPRHTRFAPPDLDKVMTTEETEPGVWMVHDPLPPEPTR
jgi:protein O-mannosyl-transferase